MSGGAVAFLASLLICSRSFVGVVTTNNSRKLFFPSSIGVMSVTSSGSESGAAWPFTQKMGAIFQKRKRLFTGLDQKRAGRATADANPSIAIALASESFRMYLYLLRCRNSMRFAPKCGNSTSLLRCPCRWPFCRLGGPVALKVDI